MAKEIERKFLVNKDGWKKLDLLKKINITQGYMHKTKALTVRVRVTDTQAYLTVKGATVGISRDEFEYEVPYQDGVELLKMCPKPHISKTRHVCRDVKNQLWEVDIFKGINRGLAIAEIELPSEKTVVELPEWIGTEVSHDKRYTNSYLVNNKVPRR